ncbi:MAG: TetR family transcriptional regulator [Denitrovibrio sp.]|nr:MAG: TetR family transcriptional regulator [Denitrovibrio sp.]
MNKIPVKTRILETASRLFYVQGYRATGINQIIKEAEIAKASFYQHFPSKEDLCITYLEDRHNIAHERQKMFITDGNNAIDRVCNLFENIRQNAINNNFNGCHFLNIASEINEHESKIRLIVTKHKSRLMWLIEDQLQGYDNPEEMSEIIYVIYEGANIAVKNYRDTWPIDRAIKTTRAMLERGTK